MLRFLRSTKGLLAYSLFDFGNSAFTLIVHAYAFPLFFKDYLLKGNPRADLYWGLLFSGSAVIAAVAAPWVGKLADGRGRMGVFAAAAGVSFATTFGLALSIGSNTTSIIVTFVFANVAFYIASNIYDSLLATITDPSNRVRYSAFAWGFGYLGGVACFVLVFAAQQRAGLASASPYLVMALFYAVFGTLSILRLRRHVSGFIRVEQVSFQQMLAVMDRPRLLLLAGYWLIADSVNAIIAFIAIYGSSQFGLSATAIGAYLLLVQVLAFPNTYLMSLLAQRVGSSLGLAICVAIWVAIIVFLVFSGSPMLFPLIALLTSMVIGTTQSLMRAQYSMYLEPSRSSEVFGWYAIATESATIFAPALFGVVSVYLGGQRAAMALLSLPLIAGLLLTRRALALFQTTRHLG